MHVFFVTAAFVFEAVGLGCLFLAFRVATEANGLPPVWKVGLRRLMAKVRRPKPHNGTISTTLGDGLSLEDRGYVTVIKGPKDGSIEARFEAIEANIKDLKEQATKETIERDNMERRLKQAIRDTKRELLVEMKQREREDRETERLTLNLELWSLVWIAIGVLCAVGATLTA